MNTGRRDLMAGALKTAAVLSAGFGCGRKRNDAIAVVPKGSTHEFWKAVRAGALRSSVASGVPLLWKGPLREDDREEQIRVVESLIGLRVRALALAPLDDVALAPVVADATRAGIPVLAFDSALKSDDLVGYVATDNRVAGRQAGDELARRLGGRGRVAVLRCQEGSASTSEREAGFLEAMAAHAGITVVSKNQYGGVTTESSFRVAENLLSSLRAGTPASHVDGLFTPNESTTFGLLRALEELGLAGKLAFVGFDSSKKLTEALSTGKLSALVVQDPARMGELCFSTLVDHLSGRPHAPRVMLPATVVTAANMDKPAQRQLLSPPV